MRVIGHMVIDGEVLHQYFHEDAPTRQMWWFIENHTKQIFDARLAHIPSAFLLPGEGDDVEMAVVTDIMDCRDPNEPVLHVILQPVLPDEGEGVMS